MMSLPCFILLAFCAVAAARPRIYRQTGSLACPVREQLESPGTITSPGYPGPYPANSTCTWIILAPKGAIIEVEFSTFDVKTGPSCGTSRPCKCDYVQVKETKKSTSRYTGKFCEGYIPRGVIQVPSSKARVLFRSDGSNQGNGFSLKFWFVNLTTSPTTDQQVNTTTLVVPTNTSTRGVVLVAATTERSATSKPPSPNKTQNVLTNTASPYPSKVFEPTSIVNHENTGKYTPVKSAIKVSSSTPLKNDRAPGSGVTIRAARSTPSKNRSAAVVMFYEDKQKAKEAEEEADPPDEIVLGPSIPIILIFIGVVAAIAWWKFRSDKKELLRYYKEQIRFEEISKRKRNTSKKKQNMRDIRTKKLYSDMAKNWQGQSGSTFIDSRTKRSFAGRLLELAEKPVSFIRTPRSSRPSSMHVQEEAVPLVVLREKTRRSQSLDPSMQGHVPPSRPASVLLRDALNMIFGATSAESSSETPKSLGSEFASKRASTRVSFYDVLVEKMAQVEEAEHEEKTKIEKEDDKKKEEKEEEKRQSTRLLIPQIMVRQPSYESNEDLTKGFKSPAVESNNVPDPEESKVQSPPEANIEPEQSTSQQSEPTQETGSPRDTDHPGDPGASTADQPRTFEKELVEMLEELQQENGEEKEKEERDELQGPSPPPVPHQTPDPRDSASTSPADRMNCQDLEDFLLNLDRELEEADREP